MTKNKIIDIDSEFDGVEFDEAAINRATGNKKGGDIRRVMWRNEPHRRVNQSKIRKEKNKELFGGYKWIVCSPGNDMLPFYDEQNRLLGEDNRAHSAIPPSIVYHYRFEHKYPEELFDKSKNYGRFAYLRDQLKHLFTPKDITYWAQVFYKRYDWMVDKPHEEWVFNNRLEVTEFLAKISKQEAFSINLSVHENITGNGKRKTSDMFWRGKLKGWSIHIVDTKTYEKSKSNY